MLEEQAALLEKYRRNAEVRQTELSEAQDQLRGKQRASDIQLDSAKEETVKHSEWISELSTEAADTKMSHKDVSRQTS